MPTCPQCRLPFPPEVLICPRDQIALTEPLDGRYRILRPLGEGGMGRVYAAEHTTLGKPFAVKVLRAELSSDATIARRFELEGIAAGRIGNDHIVNVSDFGRTPEGALYLVMEMLSGESLEARVRRLGALPLPSALRILAQIARALRAAHVGGIVHRDVKPQNVMLLTREGRDDYVKLLDFGVSKVPGAHNRPLTEQGEMLGTAEYMAPEQIEGTTVDARADIYSWGALAYELLTGSTPFAGPTTVAVLFAQMKELPQRLSQRRPDLQFPAGLEALVLRCLAKRPEERPQSFDEILTALGQRSVTPQAAMNDVATPPVREATPTQMDRPIKLPRRRWPLSALAAVALLSIGGLLWWMNARDDAVPPSTTIAERSVPVAPPEPRSAPVVPDTKPTAPSGVLVESVPSGAIVHLGDQVLGATPVRVSSAASESLRVTAPGFEDESVWIDPRSPEVTVTLRPKNATPRHPKEAPRRDLKPDPF